MCQKNRRQYVPENWPVDGIKHSEPIEKTNKCFCPTKITVQVMASHYLEGCFKARQMAHFVRNCWM